MRPHLGRPGVFAEQWNRLLLMSFPRKRELSSAMRSQGFAIRVPAFAQGCPKKLLLGCGMYALVE